MCAPEWPCRTCFVCCFFEQIAAVLMISLSRLVFLMPNTVAIPVDGAVFVTGLQYRLFEHVGIEHGVLLAMLLSAWFVRI